MSTENHAYTLAEVLAEGFEACCVDLDGCRYLWHGDRGIRWDEHHGIRTMVTRPSLLPDVEWFPTELGAKEIAEASPDKA